MKWRKYMYKKLLLPTDGSEQSMRAGEHAIWNANLSGADIVVLSVIDTYYLNSIAQMDLRNKTDQFLTNDAEVAVEKFSKELEISQCDGQCLNVNLKTIIKSGKPYEVIIQTIKDENIDLVVMGASGKQGVGRLFLGSTTERVVRQASCPVLVVP
jgi:nucleotide-binding universal stress UspA family protein